MYEYEFLLSKVGTNNNYPFFINDFLDETVHKSVSSFMDTNQNLFKARVGNSFFLALLMFLKKALRVTSMF